jgi:acetyltransferase-like isoleucine patch superfamily enzyme
MFLKLFQRKWAELWLRFGGVNPTGRIAYRIASWAAPPYKARGYLAHLHPRGYISPNALIHHNNLDFDEHVFIGDRVVIYQTNKGGPVKIGKKSKIHLGTIIETGEGGSLTIGADTHIQPRCQFSAYLGSILIGSGVQIAPYCAFYPYNHSFYSDKEIKAQPLQTKGDIIVDDDALLGVGVIVTDNVRIGKGAVIGAGSVVTRDIPDGYIAAGNPAHIIHKREEIINPND